MMGPSCWFKMVVRGAASAAVQLRVCISCELLMHMSNDKHFHTAGYVITHFVEGTVRQLATTWYLQWLCGQGFWE